MLFNYHDYSSVAVLSLSVFSVVSGTLMQSNYRVCWCIKNMLILAVIQVCWFVYVVSLLVRLDKQVCCANSLSFVDLLGQLVKRD